MTNYIFVLQIDKLNRYGNRTITTGTIKVVSNVLIQNNASKVKKSERHKHNQKQTVISNVLSAYQEARDRLETITKNPK